MATKIGNTQITFPDGSVQANRFMQDTDSQGELIQIDTFPPSNSHNLSVSGGYTWTKPSGCRYVRAVVVGGGGGSCAHGESGAAGGMAEKYIDVSGYSTVSVTVGGRGWGGGYYSNCGDGGTSSFGPWISASGGYGANRNWGHSGGHGGQGHGGDINVFGGGGSGHDNRGGKGGMSFYGGSKFPGWSNNSYGYTGEDHYQAPGAGGSSCHSNHSRGGYGASGIVVVYSYR
jgi:hypothetical protein